MSSPDDAHLRAVGEVSEAAAVLELFATSILSWTIDAGLIGTATVAGESFAWVASKLQAIARLRSDDPRCATFLDALADARRAYDRRNQILHAAWIEVDGDEDSREPFKFQRGKVTIASGERVTVSDLKQVAQDIRIAVRGLQENTDFVLGVGTDAELRRASTRVVGPRPATR